MVSIDWLEQSNSKRAGALFDHPILKHSRKVHSSRSADSAALDKEECSSVPCEGLQRAGWCDSSLLFYPETDLHVHILYLSIHSCIVTCALQFSSGWILTRTCGDFTLIWSGRKWSTMH